MITRAAAVWTVLGVVILAGIDEWIGRSQVFGDSWPPLSTVLRQYGSETTRSSLSYAFEATIPAALKGLVLGMVIGVLLAGAGSLLLILEDGLASAAAAVHAIPIIVVAPVLVSTTDRSDIPMYLAALSSLFVAYVSVERGLHSSRPAHEDVFTALGAGQVRRLLHLRALAAIPLTLEGLRLAFTASMLGAVLGEWFGSPRGVGVLLVSSMQSGDSVLLWTAALTTSLITLVGYGVILVAEVPARRRFLG
ncbi:ABC transporter permease subunit [Actinomadura madurae]|uniref:ABC transporter permease n=1 Tax=Actinomadura madurae TaxID=1993 RepID=UPI003999AE57